MAEKVTPLRGGPPAADVVERKANNLPSKLAAISYAIGRIEKRGFNREQNYKFASESDIVDAVKRECYEHNVALRFAVVPESERYSPFTSSKGTLGTECSLRLKMTMVDGDDPEQSVEEIFPGLARDYGDKALWKAITGAKKYALICTFNVSTGDDPEHSGAGDADRGNRQTNGSPSDAGDRREREQAMAAIAKLVREEKPPAAMLVELCGEISDGHITDWTRLGVPGLRAFRQQLAERVKKPDPRPESAYEAPDGSQVAEATPQASEREQTQTAATPETQSPRAVATDDVAAWVETKLRSLGLADDDADVLEICGQVSADAAHAGRRESTTYSWRELGADDLRTFWRELSKARKAATR